ncbi:MAG: SEL1-like repeat protein [Alphaproteobacteria bacterium]
MRLFISLLFISFLTLPLRAQTAELPSMSVQSMVENPTEPIKVDFSMPERVRKILLKNYKEKYSELFHKAIKGDPASQYLVGLAHESGDIGYKDTATAFSWYLKAAKQQHDEAQFKTAEAYYNGIGTKVKPEDALEWYHKVAEKNHIESLKKLSEIYAKGIPGILEPNRPISIKWLTSAALSEDVESQIKMGILYREGINAPLNLRKATRWLKAAAGNGSLKAQVELADLYYNGRGIMKKDGEAIKLLQIAIENKKAPAKAFYQLGLMNYFGAGIKRDFEKAMELFLIAAKKKDLNAQISISEMYQKGQGIPDGRKNPKKAVMWLEKAIKQGSHEAKYRMAKLCLEGEIVPKDKKKALALFKETASYGHAPSMGELGNYYLAKEDFKNAYIWFRLAEMRQRDRMKKRMITARRKQLERQVPRHEFPDAQKAVKSFKVKVIEEKKKKKK